MDIVWILGTSWGDPWFLDGCGSPTVGIDVSVAVAVATRGGVPLDEPFGLHHERLDAYKVAIEFLAFSGKVLDRFPGGYGALADQLRRAFLSIPLNIAEGYGKRSNDDRSRFYDISRGSAHECAAIPDASRILAIIDEQTLMEGKSLLYCVVSMLVKMVR